MSTQSDYFIKNVLTLSNIYANNNPLPKWIFPKMVLLCNMEKTSRSGQALIVQSALLEWRNKRQEITPCACLSHSTFALQRGLWVIKCGWVCPWSCHHLPCSKATNWNFPKGVRGMRERSKERENRKASPKQKCMVTERRQGGGYSHYRWQ